ncbi:MAG: ADP-ribosylglycohydrolase family protein [Pseudomonadota bacterium]|nr:ADP-ribosylglycohydrolase family protein [Pseudomonadota bacterium]
MGKHLRPGQAHVQPTVIRRRAAIAHPAGAVVSGIQACHADLERARRSLAGLSLGDAFGDRFDGPPGQVRAQLQRRELPGGPWRVTDDTMMAMAVIEVLSEHGRIDQDALAHRLGTRYLREPARGYGAGAHQILARIAAGEHWSRAARAVFEGAGSMGNGGAMRAAPVGAYFADDPARAAREAARAAEVTHAHPDGQAGAVAVALAAAWIANGTRRPELLFERVLAMTPAGDTRTVLQRAALLSLATPVTEAAARLGSGRRVLSSDTVPFALWCAARHLGDYQAALWSTVAGLGDRDTTCAIVGSLVALAPGVLLPADWIAAREPIDGL